MRQVQQQRSDLSQQQRRWHLLGVVWWRAARQRSRGLLQLLSLPGQVPGHWLKQWRGHVRRKQVHSMGQLLLAVLLGTQASLQVQQAALETSNKTCGSNCVSSSRAAGS